MLPQPLWRRRGHARGSCLPTRTARGGRCRSLAAVSAGSHALQGLAVLGRAPVGEVDTVLEVRPEAQGAHPGPLPPEAHDPEGGEKAGHRLQLADHAEVLPKKCRQAAEVARGEDGARPRAAAAARLEWIPSVEAAVRTLGVEGAE
jgi:hypothetical protein